MVKVLITLRQYFFHVKIAILRELDVELVRKSFKMYKEIILTHNFLFEIYLCFIIFAIASNASLTRGSG
jgi:hypothetical protein